ncbi:MAG TPA: hypothetical protein PLJ04_03420, partial [Candidatus Saccharibacteria bacterium]|nr:hypothetical protein [Candidatus Saccharibacteria bacterium]
AQGRLTAAGNTAIAINGNQITSGTVAVANGGTGATNAAGARTNLVLPQAASSSDDNSIYSKDSRAVNDAPQDRNRGLYVDFKQNATNGLSDGGTYNGVLNFRKYGSGTDMSGGEVTQLAVTDNDNLWIRNSTSGTTWGSWYKFWHSGNDGASSGLDADLLDGQSGSYYQNATNINAGTLGDSYLSANVALLNNTQTFSGAKTFSATLTAAAINMSGNFSQTGATTFSTGTGTNTLNGATTLASTLQVNGNTTLGDANTDTTTVRGLTTLSDSSSTYPLRFGADVDLYRGAADRLDLATGDSLNLVSGSIQQNGTNRLTSAGLFQAADGAVGGPAYSFSSDTNTGMYLVSADTLGFSAGGAEKLRVDTNGAAFNGLFRAGGNYYNVVSYNYNGTPTNAIKIKTNLPYTNSSQMPTINIKGYSFGNSAPIDINLVWYVYNGNFANYKASSSGGVTPTIKLANESGLVTITLEYTPYYARFQVNAFAQGMSETPSWFNGWTVADEAAGATNQVTVAYQNRFGTITGG